MASLRLWLFPKAQAQISGIGQVLLEHVSFTILRHGWKRTSKTARGGFSPQVTSAIFGGVRLPPSAA